MVGRSERLENVVGMILIGDGMLALTDPTAHNLLWQGRLPGWSRALGWFAEHPRVTRVGAALQIGMGIWIGRSAQRAKLHADARGA